MGFLVNGCGRGCRSWKGETGALEGRLVACCVWMVRRWVVRIDVGGGMLCIYR
jgi:hypothetical protein